MAIYPFRPYRWSSGTKKWDWHRLLICIVSKGDNLQVQSLNLPPSEEVTSNSVKAVSRAMANVQPVTKLDKRIETHLLIEAYSEQRFSPFQRDGVSITSVPAAYKPKKATYKARALEYFRREQSLTNKDWVLHLDEETIIDVHVIQTCIDFIERRERAMQLAAQGIILYNSYRYWNNWLLTAADLIRVIDDFGHFQFQLNCLGKALDGFHGSFLLLNGEAENSVTWETDSIVEDMYFGLEVCIDLHVACSKHYLYDMCADKTLQSASRPRHLDLNARGCPALLENSHLSPLKIIFTNVAVGMQEHGHYKGHTCASYSFFG